MNTFYFPVQSGVVNFFQRRSLIENVDLADLMGLCTTTQIHWQQKGSHRQYVIEQGAEFPSTVLLTKAVIWP